MDDRLVEGRRVAYLHFQAFEAPRGRGELPKRADESDTILLHETDILAIVEGDPGTLAN